MSNTRGKDAACNPIHCICKKNDFPAPDFFFHAFTFVEPKGQFPWAVNSEAKK
jgi:hypothetical protein